MSSILDSISVTTDIDNFDLNKKLKLFNELTKAISVSKGTLSKEHRFVIEKMNVAFKSVCMKLKNVTKERDSLVQEETPLHYNNQNHRESYANVVQNKREEFPVIVRNVTGTNLDIEKEICDKLSSVDSQVDFLNIRKRDDKVIFRTRNKDQQEEMISNLSNDKRFECKAPSKLIPSIMIMRINKKYSENEILEELCAKNGIEKVKSSIKLLPTNPSFRTNRAILKCSSEDTLKININKELKLGFMIHPVKFLYNSNQCYGCQGFNHFEFNKEKTVRTCKNKSRCGHCASEQHTFRECPAKNDASKAKCCNCNGNHRSNSSKCKNKEEQDNSSRIKYIC